MPSEFAVTEQGPQAGHHVIAVRGEIDLFTAPQLKQAVVEAIDAGDDRVVIDLSELTFLDSTGLGVLIGAVRRLRAKGGALAIVNTEPSIAKTFQITGLDKVFTILPTRAEALAALDDSLDGATPAS
jgi:anti-sigma B factor antagonist